MLNAEELLEQLVKALVPAIDSCLYCWVRSVFLDGLVSKYMGFCKNVAIFVCLVLDRSASFPCHTEPDIVL